MKISVIIPVYNEVESINELYKQLLKALQEFSRYEIIFIDDGSSDGSVETIKKISELDNSINLIQFHRNYGKSAALAEGFKHAKGNYIVTMDADLQNDPADIPLLLEKINEYDVVCGWRYKRNDPWIKKLSSRIANAVRNNLSEESIADTGCSLKAFRPCIKLYLKGRVETPFLKINAKEWEMASVLPLDAFQKQANTKVWADSRRIIG